MNPVITAAFIAGSVSLISLIGTVVIAVRGFQATEQVTTKTLAAQREQLAEQHIQTLNARFATAAEQLGFDKPAAVRIAGIYAMAGLADDWEDNRQTCIDVLCGYLRMPYAADPGDGEARLGFMADREVRHTAIRVITDHFRDGAKVSWRGKDLNFIGAAFDGGDFSQARFSAGMINFSGAMFNSGTFDFRDTKFSGSTVDFRHTAFDGSTVDFREAEFSGGTIYFMDSAFNGGMVNFGEARFSGSMVDFTHSAFNGGTIDFRKAEFSSGTLDLRSSLFNGGTVNFGEARFSGGEVNFGGSAFNGSIIDLNKAKFSKGTVDFRNSKLNGGSVDFTAAEFTGGTVDFSIVEQWRRPPQFDWAVGSVPPDGVKLPRRYEASSDEDGV